MIGVLANALVPVFIGLLIGYAAGLRGVVDNRNVKSLVTFVMSFAIPCYLYLTVAGTPRHLLWNQGKVALVLAAVYAALFVTTYVATRDSASNRAVLALTLGFPNAAAIGLPLLQSLYGGRAGVTVAIAIAIGSVTVSPVTLAILESETSAGKKISAFARLRLSVWKALKRPIVWAPLLALVAVATNFTLPGYFERSLTIFAEATAGTALFMTGLVVSAQRFSFNWPVAWAVCGKNVLQPTLCLLVAHLVRMSQEQTCYVVLISAIPCGFFGIFFGENFDATPEMASSSLIASYVLGIFTLGGWIVLMSHLHWG